MRNTSALVVLTLLILTPSTDGPSLASARATANAGPERYEPAVQVPDEVFARLRITPHAFHGDWNYTIAPRH